MVAALLLAALAPARQASAANGALAVDDTDVDPVGTCKVDSWISFASNSDRLGVTSPGCVFDLGQPIDVTLGFARARDDGEWSTTGAAKLRTLVVPGGVGKFSLLFSTGAIFDLRTGELSNALVNIPVTFQALENLKFNVNGGWLYDHVTKLHWGTWGASVDWSVNDRISLIGEVFGLFGSREQDRPLANDPRGQFAVRFKPRETVDFDVIYGRNITGQKAHWITFGLNVRFDAFGETEVATLRSPADPQIVSQQRPSRPQRSSPARARHAAPRGRRRRRSGGGMRSRRPR
jgi:hypothetical protein